MTKINCSQNYNYKVLSNPLNDNENVEFQESQVQEFDKSKGVSSETSKAARAYGLGFINANKTIPQMSLKALIRRLEEQGKVEGKDFDIDSTCTMGNAVVTLKDKNDNEILRVHYDNGNHSTWNCYETNEYKDGQRSKTISRNADGEMMRVTKYYNYDDPKSKYLDDYLTYGTTSEEYEQYLKDNNIKYKTEYDENDNSSHVTILVLDDNNRVKDKACFYYPNKEDEIPISVMKYNLNENGDAYRMFCYNPDNVEVTTYLH